MYSKKQFILSSILLFILFSGCLSSYLREGTKYQKQGMIEQSIHSFEQGIQKSPQSYKLYNALSNAKYLLSKEKYNRSLNDLESIIDIIRLNNGYMILKESIDLNNSAILDMEKANSILNEKGKTNKSSLDITQLEDYKNVLRNSENKFLSAIGISKERLKENITLADNNFLRSEWSQAKQYYEIALGYESTNENVQKSIRIASLMIRGIDSFNTMQFDSAVSSFSEILNINSTFSAAKNWLNKTKKKEADYYYDSSITERNKGNLENSIKLLEKCLKVIPNYPNAQNLSDQLIRKFSIAHYARASEYEKKSLFHHAYMEYRSLIENGGQKYYPQAYTKMKALENKIHSNACFRIAVIDQVGFGGSQATRNVSQSVLSQLFDSDIRKKGYIKVLTREQIRDILNEMRLSQSGIVDPTTITNTGAVKGVSYFVTIEVTYFDGNENHSIIDSGEKQYVDHIEKVPNPEYVPPNQRKKSENILESFGELMEEITVPKTINKNIYGYCRYEKIKYEVNAKIDIAISVFSASTGEILISDLISVDKKEYDDEMRILSGDSKKAGINKDSKQIKSKYNLMEEVKNEGINKTADKIYKQFENIPIIYQKSGDELLKSGDNNSAIEEFVNAILIDEIEERKNALIVKVKILLEIH